MKLLTFEQFNIVNESAKIFEADLDATLEQIITEAKDDNTSIGDVIPNPIKFIKIKNNAKKYQKALVQQALNDIDLEKKKAASKAQDKPTGTLVAANKAKNASLRDLATSISDRMDSLASTDILKKVATVAKSKAKVAAAQTALKAADAVETKELKLKIKNLNKHASDATADIKDYEHDQSTDNKEEAPTSDFESGKSDEKQKKEAPTSDSSSEKSDEKHTEESPKKTELHEKITKQQDKIEKLKASIEESEKEIPKLKADLEEVKGTDKEKAAADELASAIQVINQNKKGLEEEETTLNKLKEELNKL